MFTLEESALLARMLRFLGWVTVCLLATGGGLVLYHWVESPHIRAHAPGLVHPVHPVDAAPARHHS